MEGNMRKSDLKDGMILVTSNKNIGILISKKVKNFYNLYAGGSILDIENLNDDLTHKDLKQYSIDKIYKIIDISNYCLMTILRDLPQKAVELIWERQKEVDWSKVPKWTKVQTSDYKDRFIDEGYLVSYEPRLEKFPFIAAIENLNIGACSYKYCRIHPDVEIKEEWYK